MGYRRRARECALQLLYQFDFTHDHADEILKHFWEMREAQPAPVMELAEKLFRDSLAKRMEIDQLIRAHSHHWQIDRMSSVDRNILRVGVCELLTVEASQAPVVINEALEVAKKYSGEDSSKFINGVLDGIRIALRSQSEKNASPEKRTTAHLEDSE